MRILIVSLIKLLFSWFSVNTVTGYLKSIEPLNGTNYPTILAGIMRFRWPLLCASMISPYMRTSQQILLMPMVLPLRRGRDVTGWSAWSLSKWSQLPFVVLFLIRTRMVIDLTTKAYLAKVEENFKSSSKTYVSTLIMKMMTSQYDGQSRIREPIMSMCDMANKLKTLIWLFMMFFWCTSSWLHCLHSTISSK